MEISLLMGRRVIFLMYNRRSLCGTTYGCKGVVRGQNYVFPQRPEREFRFGRGPVVTALDVTVNQNHIAHFIFDSVTLPRNLTSQRVLLRFSRRPLHDLEILAAVKTYQKSLSPFSGVS